MLPTSYLPKRLGNSAGEALPESADERWAFRLRWVLWGFLLAWALDAARIFG
jgi:hypothetical protein